MEVLPLTELLMPIVTSQRDFKKKHMLLNTILGRKTSKRSKRWTFNNRLMIRYIVRETWCSELLIKQDDLEVAKTDSKSIQPISARGNNMRCYRDTRGR